MAAMIELMMAMSRREASRLLGASRATFYRRQKPPVYGPRRPRPVPHNRLDDTEIARVRSILNAPENCEAAFKTLKYCPAFHGNFGSIEDARAFCETFFKYYNEEHYHSGIGLLRPATVHFGRADTVIAARNATLAHAHAANPKRFTKPPTAPKLPKEAWINDPSRETLSNTHKKPTGLKVLDMYREDQERGRTRREFHIGERVMCHGRPRGSESFRSRRRSGQRHGRERWSVQVDPTHAATPLGDDRYRQPPGQPRWRSLRHEY
jgi:hypothetical protein